MNVPRSVVREEVVGYASRLRFPKLFLLTAVLFVIDLIIPDIIPLLDEILLGCATLMLGTLRERFRTRVVDAPQDPSPR